MWEKDEYSLNVAYSNHSLLGCERKVQICGNKMPTRCNRGFFYCRSYCLLNMFRAPLCSSSGAQEYYIRWLLPVVFRAVVFKLLVWCGAEGCVSGLQDA